MERPSSRFEDRHIGPRLHEQESMVAQLGFSSLSALIEEAVPEAIKSPDLELPPALTEAEVGAELRRIASKNTVLKSMIGLGYYGTHTPEVLTRNVLENPGWYTAYTPYQPEISQGRLEALLNFQTMVADLTGLELANASLLDEATAAAEAMAMCRRVSKKESRRFFVDADVHPQTLAVLQTRARPLGIELVVNDAEEAGHHDVFGAIFQYPGSSGVVSNLAPVIAEVHKQGGLAVVAADLLALVMLASPGELGADVAIGSTQRFGVPLGFGGPHAAYIATGSGYSRALPGRVVGVSVDSAGNTAYRLALQTREQHIRREKATSNICTAQVLLAVMAGFYAVYHGPDGLRDIASRVHSHAVALGAGLRNGGYRLRHRIFFDTIEVEIEGRAPEVVAAARERGINLRLVDDDTVAVAVDETTTASDLETVWEVFDVTGASVSELVETIPSPIPESWRRTSEFLTHPVFTMYQSETEMMRYLRRLADRDIALDRSMIPLGSCTMKLNAAVEMKAITWPEFADVHPFAPLDQAAGYLELFADLERRLAEITGYDAVSLQPNAGSQGEYAGLLAIAAYHRDRGEPERTVCLIPASAHGTNPASAAMAGMDVVVVKTDEHGNVDIEDLRAKADEHADRVAALMVTYPSTHGVFEQHITEICDIIHDAGGQVYLDGANLNAMVGVAKPGDFGADVSHLNLHKTFCIPHGGGGPGVGPIGVKAHLAPHLPNHPMVADAGPPTGVGAVAAAPWGSAGVLPISWAFLALMGAEGLRKATQVAILNANYIAHRLSGHYPVLYTGAAGLVAHECVIDLRPLHKDTDITVDDIAKRLVDYGFHAPTMSFPVPGTLMIEPTESESLAELNRFCDAMIAIREEIDQIDKGEWPLDESPLRRAPHTADDVVAAEWSRPYSRKVAVFPAGVDPDKYWPPVGRVDNKYGDMNLMCACPPIEEYR